MLPQSTCGYHISLKSFLYDVNLPCYVKHRQHRLYKKVDNIMSQILKMSQAAGFGYFDVNSACETNNLTARSYAITLHTLLLLL